MQPETRLCLRPFSGRRLITLPLSQILQPRRHSIVRVWRPDVVQSIPPSLDHRGRYRILWGKGGIRLACHVVLKYLTLDLIRLILAIFKLSRPQCSESIFMVVAEACSLAGWTRHSAASILLRDIINATVGFAQLAIRVDIPERTLMRMFGPAGNPRAENLIAVVAALKDECHLSLTVHAAPLRRRAARAMADAAS